MKIENIEASVKAIVAEQLGVEDTQVTVDKKLAEDLGADSLDKVELMMAFEDEYGISISDDDADKLGSVQDIILYVSEHAPD